jgi:hypothetical protein
MFQTKLPLQQPKLEFLNATTMCESNLAIPISSAVPVFNASCAHEKFFIRRYTPHE